LVISQGNSEIFHAGLFIGWSETLIPLTKPFIRGWEDTSEGVKGCSGGRPWVQTQWERPFPIEFEERILMS
ncbi:MAG TPA: hypothetical protein VNZ44_10735, partial [Pyrinomonadaceae bacterium]|nr:hypothetical protein [Pyrinomonadaceae bacterium]